MQCLKALKAFADHPFGSWVINGLAVMAFFIVMHVLVSRLQDSGLLGAIKAVILSA